MLERGKEMLTILSGMFALSNMGQPLPDLDLVIRMIKSPPITPNESVCRFARSLIESDEIENAFTEEAESWFKTLSDPKEFERYQFNHPDIFKLYKQAQSIVRRIRVAKEVLENYSFGSICSVEFAVSRLEIKIPISKCYGNIIDSKTLDNLLSVLQEREVVQTFTKVMWVGIKDNQFYIWCVV